MTTLLVGAFVVMIALIGAVVGAVVTLAISPDVPGGNLTFDPEVFFAVAGAAMVIVAITALVRIAMLGGDGAKVAKSLGGTEITESDSNPYHRRYFNVVEEMAIASGLPRPRVFVINHEKGINAFAAGSSPEKAAVGMTHGALAKLNRQELAGVVAHEMAHIANADTRLNTRLMGMVFGLVALYTMGRITLRSMMFSRRGGNRNNGAPVVLVMAVALLILGALGVLGGRALQAMISRKREYLADATAVRFTRNPSGLANALKKIGATAGGAKVQNGHAEEARHMFFCSLNTPMFGLLSTHPPLLDRIRALEPEFDPSSDPVWNLEEKAIMRDARSEFAGPWGTNSP